MTLQAQHDQAAAAHRRGDLVEAERLYREMLETAPFAARHMLGVLKAQLGALPEALELIGAALALKPDAPDALFNYGKVLQRAGRLDEALAAYEQALAVRPGYEAAQGALEETRGLLAEALNRDGNDKRAAGRPGDALAD